MELSLARSKSGEEPNYFTPSNTEPAAQPAATIPDAQTIRILSYLATHDHATQRELAQALGVTVRTVQHKQGHSLLAALPAVFEAAPFPIAWEPGT
jgi:predicted transcriptional regulator